MLIFIPGWYFNNLILDSFAVSFEIYFFCGLMFKRRRSKHLLRPPMLLSICFYCSSHVTRQNAPQENPAFLSWHVPAHRELTHPQNKDRQMSETTPFLYWKTPTNGHPMTKTPQLKIR